MFEELTDRTWEAGEWGDPLASTLEGQIVRVADSVAYLNHDIAGRQEPAARVPGRVADPGSAGRQGTDHRELGSGGKTDELTVADVVRRAERRGDTDRKRKTQACCNRRKFVE